MAKRQVAVFLSVIGEKDYALLRNLLSPAKPSDETLAELTAALKKHFALKRPVIAERFWFYRREEATGKASQTTSQSCDAWPLIAISEGAWTKRSRTG